MCIHRKLVCDGHPQCLNHEDEDFIRCKKKWIEYRVFPQQATVKCRSKMYPGMDIVATACDNIVECHDSSDESFCSDETVSELILVVSVFLILFLYLGFRYHSRIAVILTFSKTKCKKSRKISRRHVSKEDIFEEFKNEHNKTQIINKVNKYFFYILSTKVKEHRNQIFIEFYDLLSKLLNHDEAEVYAHGIMGRRFPDGGLLRYRK